MGHRRAPELVLLHGGAQNAHTWDTVALALGRPLLAIDLPGHGHSDWREDHAYFPVENARAVATVIRELAPDALGRRHVPRRAHRVPPSPRGPRLVRRLILVDVTPGVDQTRRRR